MRSSKTKLNSSLKKEVINSLTQLLASLKKQEEVKLFLNDFMSETELELFSKRLAVIYWLKKGRSYNNIKNNLKVSSATIAATQQMLEKKGVKMAIKELEADEWAATWEQKIKKIVGK